MINKKTSFYHLSIEDAISEIRLIRNKLLKEEIDSINPMRWELMTTEQQDEWRAYRQSLLDMPDKLSPTFEITWPTKP